MNSRILVAANFVIYRFRRDEKIREYVGSYRFALKPTPDGLKIAERIVRLDALELASLGSVSFVVVDVLGGVGVGHGVVGAHVRRGPGRRG